MSTASYVFGSFRSLNMVVGQTAGLTSNPHGEVDGHYRPTQNTRVYRDTATHKVMTAVGSRYIEPRARIKPTYYTPAANGVAVRSVLTVADLGVIPSLYDPSIAAPVAPRIPFGYALGVYYTGTAAEHRELWEQADKEMDKAVERGLAKSCLNPSWAEYYFLLAYCARKVRELGFDSTPIAGPLLDSVIGPLDVQNGTFFTNREKVWNSVYEFLRVLSYASHKAAVDSRPVTPSSTVATTPTCATPPSCDLVMQTYMSPANSPVTHLPPNFDAYGI